MAWRIPDGAAAAALRALDVQGVARWAALLLPGDPDVPVALRRQRMDGAALLAASAELLRGHYGLPDGPARALVSAVEAARGLLPRDAVFKLRLLPSRGAKASAAYTVSVTPYTFAARFTSLCAASPDGDHVNDVFSLEEAHASVAQGLRLCARPAVEDRVRSRGEL